MQVEDAEGAIPADDVAAGLRQTLVAHTRDPGTGEPSETVVTGSVISTDPDRGTGTAAPGTDVTGNSTAADQANDLRDLVPYGPERPLRPGPISVFVSRQAGKLFVRKAFEPLFEAPVTFTNPNVPLGTHVFTAVETGQEGSALRWIAVSLPPETPRSTQASGHSRHRTGKSAGHFAKEAPVLLLPTSPARALDGISIPPDAIQRISELVTPGASLILSDHGISGETGQETDFIILTR